MKTATSGMFNYAEALQKSFLFYEANRAGDLPDDNRIPWREDSTLSDGQDVGRDLSGGYFDAGDHVKFGLPMAASMTMLAWGLDEYQAAYESIGQQDEALEAIKWGTDYFLKAYDDKGTKTVADDVFYGQVGNGQADHSFWGPAELLNMERPSYSIDANNAGSDVTGETAAALASASMVFRASDAAYADQLLDKAKQLYSFAETYRGKYSDSITDAQSFYNSWSGYTDELAWGAAWLHKATKAAGKTDAAYLQKAEDYFQEGGGIANAPWTQNWDDKRYGTAILLAQETGSAKYQSQVESWLDRWLVDRQSGGIPEYTEGGLAWLDQWGSLRYSANTSMLAGIYADTVNDKNGQYSEFVASQLNYILGDNPNNRSYVVGFGENSPENPHHRGAHGSTNNNINQGETKNVLYGALVGGPNRPDDDAWQDKRDDYIANEVATDYNAGFTGALAYMVDKFGGSAIADRDIPKLFDDSAQPPGNPNPPVDPKPPTDPNPPVDPKPLIDPQPPVDPNLPVDPDPPVDPQPPVDLEPPVDLTPGNTQVDFSVVNDWNSGFQAGIEITNNAASSLNGWTLEFEYANGITQIWNAEIVSKKGDRYTIKNVAWNGNVAADQSVSFGFIGKGDGSAVPSGFELNGELVDAPTTPGPIDPPGPIEPPTDPIDPTDGPTDPVKPTDPIDPTDPMDPTDPTNGPTGPTDPTDPVEPTDPVKPTNPTGPFVGGGKTYKLEVGKEVVGFDVTKDRIDLGSDSIHNNLPIEVEGSVGFIRQWGNTPQFVLKGVSWSDLTAENFAPIQDDHLREDASAVLAWENGTAPTRPNTVYLRSHEIGLQEEADFDPKTDKISFMYYGNRGENSEVEEIDRGVRFYSNVTGQSMLLKGVKFSDLDGSHFEARMSWLKEDDSPARMGLREAMPDLAIPAGNVFSREGIPVAGLEDRDLAYLQGFDKPYTPVAGPLLPVSKDPMASEDYKPVGQPAPTGGHQHNHSDGTHSDMMMAGGETADSVSSPMLPMIPSVADSVTDSSAPTTSPIMPLRDLAAQGSTGLLDLDTAYMGKGTFYGATGAGNAGYDEVPASQRGMLTAINRRQWDNSEASGAFLQVSGPKQRNGQADPITVMVVDQLPDRGNGLDLSVEAFAKVANPVDGVVNLDYALASPDDSFTTPYGNKIGDGLIVDRLADSNPYWPAVRLMNHRHPVESLELVAEGGELLPMKRQSYNVFVLEQGIGEPLTGKQSFVATDIFGQTAVIDNIDITNGQSEDVTTGVQFAQIG